MAQEMLLQDQEGLFVIKSIVSKKIPQWPDGLRPPQQESIPKVLDGEDLLCCVATGSGKKALYIVPIIVHQEVTAHPSLYPNFAKKACSLPVGVVVTPTKGLACSLV